MPEILKQFPLPALDARAEANAVRKGEAVTVLDREGTKHIGALEDFSSEEGFVVFIDRETRQAVRTPLTDVKILHLPTVRHWEPAGHPSGDEEQSSAIKHPSERQAFTIQFQDGDRLQGRTLGMRQARHGLFLFPQTGNDPKGGEHSFFCTFIPETAIAKLEIGDPLGSVLVQQDLASQEAVDQALGSQAKSKERPLGEYLRSHAIVTHQELESALKHQSRLPNIRLGEVLVSENCVTQEQLDMALREQKRDRSKMLGEILISQNIVTEGQIQTALSQKLGIPYVDIRHFDIDPEVLALVSEEFARKHTLMPLSNINGRLVVAVEDPLNWQTLEQARFHAGLYPEPVMAAHEDILRAIDLAYSVQQAQSLKDQDEDDEEVLEQSDNAIIRLVNKIVLDAHRMGASDIHIEPNASGPCTVRFRIDGGLTTYRELPRQMRKAVVSRIKVMADLDIANSRTPQDGKINFRRFSTLPIELRVATLPTVGGEEDAVLRLLTEGKPIALDKLNMSARNQVALLECVDQPHGIFLVCGPTGSGKTTTLHSVLDHLNTGEFKIWTVEDPVEIRQPGLRQVQMNSRAGLSFANVLRAFLRADPDIIMVGEMRDTETLRVGIEASLTGHRVFSTLHTNSAVESITRLLDMGIDPFNFADTLQGVLAQRLVRRLCPDCRAPVDHVDDKVRALATEYGYDFERAGITRDHGEIIQEWRDTISGGEDFVLYRAKGCDACGGTGYRGRIALHELLQRSTAISQLIVDKAPGSEIVALALREGMRTLRQDGIEKVLLGETDFEQIRRITAS
ncbi:MAG: GspE/PulE family protein [Gammaproteobacteria bacterium]